MKKTGYYLVLSLILLLVCCKELPEASFTHEAERYEVGYQVEFTSTSTNATAYDWNFGDGNFSSEMDPSHIYDQAGTFTVQLQVSNDDGSDAESEQLTINKKTGFLIRTTVHSPGLIGNLLGDSPDRAVNIYLPPYYYDSINKHYPVIYFLHGFTQDQNVWSGGLGLVETDFVKIMNYLLGAGDISPMIIVIPNSHNKYMGSYYTNSIVTGNWEDFIVKDLIEYVDEKYRTIPTAESRGIAGHSMGGYGTIKLAMRNPGLFKTAYALSPANLVNELVVLGSMKSFLMQAVNASSTDGLSWQAMTTVAQAAAFAPDPEAGPFYGQFPVTPSGILIDSVWQKWLKHDPYTMIPAYKDSLLKLDAIQFDCGKSDKYLYTANIHFSIALTEHGINHVFKSYDGDHVNKISERVTFYLLPFFSEHLKHDNTE